MRNLDLATCARAALSAGIVAIPLTLVLALLARRDEGAGMSGKVIVGVLIATGLLVGFAGARLATSHRLAHAAVSSVILVVAIQLTYSVVRMSLPNPLGVAYVLFLYASLGIFGGMLASWWLERVEHP